MRILYSHRTKSADGQSVHIDALTRAFIDLGHDVLISGPEGTYPAQEKRKEKMDAQQDQPNRLKSLIPQFLYEIAEVLYSIPAYLRLKAAAKNFDPDIIYERYNLYFLAGLWLKKKLGKPLVLEVNAPLVRERERHGGIGLKSLALWCERKVWREADYVLPVTQTLANIMIAEGVCAEKITVIPNGIEDRFLQEQDNQSLHDTLNLDGKVVLGFTGFIRDWHGVDLIIDFLASIENEAVHFLVVGDGPHVPTLKALTKKMNVEEKITFVGVVQRENIPLYTSLFDIALQPKVTDYASPLKLFEYMAMGKTVVAPAQPNIEEVLNHQENALLFEPENKDQLFALLNTAIDDKALRKSLGDNARDTIIRGGYTWGQNADRIASLSNFPS